MFGNEPCRQLFRLIKVRIFNIPFFTYIRGVSTNFPLLSLNGPNTSLMKRFLTLCVFSLILSTGLFAQKFKTDTIFFEFDRYDIRDEQRAQIDSLIETFIKMPSYYIEIFGHTDSIGLEPYNVELSKKRARAVTIYMLEKGIDLTRIYYEGKGTSQPVASNETFAGRRQNRRADIAVVFSTEPFSPPVQEPVVTTPVPTGPTPEELAAMARPDTVRCEYAPFFINARKNTFVIAPQGSTIFIPANAFDTDAEQISIEINELFLKSDMLINGMTTIGRDGPLAMPGIVEIDAKVNGRPVKLQPETKFRLFVPSTRNDDGSGVYYGTGGSRANVTRKGATSPLTPSMTPVKLWNEEPETKIAYSGRDKGYNFEVGRVGRFGVGRPLYQDQVSDRDDVGVDFEVILKGRRFERTTAVFITGETSKFHIPLNKKSTRVYVANGVKFISPDASLYLVAYQYDESGRPYLIRRKFKVKNEASNPKKGRPIVKLKAKFLPYEPDRFKELLLDMNV